MKLFIIALGVVLSGSAVAQTTGSAHPTREPAAENRSQISIDELVSAIFQKSKFEVEAAQLAMDKADAKSKNFALVIFADNNKMLGEISALAKTTGIALPDALDAENQAAIERMTRLKGKEFGREYDRSRLILSRQTLKLLELYAESGANRSLRLFASKYIPVRNHVRLASEMAQ